MFIFHSIFFFFIFLFIFLFHFVWLVRICWCRVLSISLSQMIFSYIIIIFLVSALFIFFVIIFVKFHTYHFTSTHVSVLFEFEFECCVWVWVWAYIETRPGSMCLLHITKLLQMFALMKTYILRTTYLWRIFLQAIQFNLFRFVRSKGVRWGRQITNPLHRFCDILHLPINTCWFSKKKNLTTLTASDVPFHRVWVTDCLTDWIQSKIGTVCSPLVCTNCARFKLFHRREHLWFCIQFNCKCFFFSLAWMILMLICQNI